MDIQIKLFKEFTILFELCIDWDKNTFSNQNEKRSFGGLLIKT